MILKSIYAKLIATFLFILALSLAYYITIFSLTMHHEIERSVHRSTFIISELLDAKLSTCAISQGKKSPEGRETIAQLLSSLKTTLHAETLWIEDNSGEIIQPANTPPLPPYSIGKIIPLTEDVMSASFLSGNRDKQVLIFPIHLWGEEGQFIIVRTTLWPPLQILLDFLVPTAGTGLLIGLIIIPLILKTLRPLKDLEQHVMAFASGDLTQRITPVHDDEIGKLSKTFNMMADNLQQMTRLRHELTANISHELRSPLTRIQMSEELARMNCEDGNLKKVLKHLDAINTEVEEMDGLVEEILKLSKLELNAHIGEIGVCDITGSMIRIMHKNSPIIERKNLTVHDGYSHDCVITCNYPMINLTLSNLISNALKFSSENGIISINTFSSTQSVIISIFNTYHRALSKDELVNIFEPFARAEGENIPGTGLGLALVAKVIEQHNGTISVENKKNGICFYIKLPRSSFPATVATAQTTEPLEREAC